MAREVTLREVAERAGVSAAAASLAPNGRPGVGEEMRAGARDRPAARPRAAAVRPCGPNRPARAGGREAAFAGPARRLLRRPDRRYAGRCPGRRPQSRLARA